LSARDQLIIRGRVLASGEGGQGGNAPMPVDAPAGGAGGGGSGGALLFESSGISIMASTLLCANGGSGGEGSDGHTGGSSGTEGTCTRPATTPRSIPSAAQGGDGGFAAITDGKNGGMVTSGSGGGGGGGVGRIRIRSISPMLIDRSAFISPAPD
jgi:hypothetical protein